MRITIKEGKKKLFIPLPNRLVFSSLSVWMLRHGVGSSEEYDKKTSLNITSRQMRRIRKCVRKMKKIHKGWCLVDVVDGEDIVKIKM